jgi:hypothetical protein
MDMKHRLDAVARYRTIRREQRASTVRLVLIVMGILAASVWWLATNLRS